MGRFSFFNIRRLPGTALAKRPRYAQKMDRIPFTGPQKWDPSPIAHPNHDHPNHGLSVSSVARCGSRQNL